ncbi:MAG: hypothetical protein Kow0089_18550 [Desulfobulbaceae bacterium]
MEARTRRQFTRVRFFRRATLHFQSRTYSPCSVRDLSLGGMYLFGNFVEEEGAYCRLVFMQSGPGTEILIKATARIVRTDKNGAAIKFVSMPFDSYMYLQTTLLYEAEDPLALGMEFPDDCPFEITETSPAEPGEPEAVPAGSNLLRLNLSS